MEELRDPTTNTILQDIPTILRHLITNNVDIDPNACAENEMQLCKIDFTTADPLTKLHKEIEDLKQSSIAVNSRYSHTQLINIALQFIKNTSDFIRALED